MLYEMQVMCDTQNNTKYKQIKVVLELALMSCIFLVVTFKMQQLEIENVWYSMIYFKQM